MPDAAYEEADHDVPVYDIPYDFEAEMLAPRRGKGRKSRNNGLDEFSALFAPSPSQATPIIGREKRHLLTKIREFKTLFPDELKTFKVKKNPKEDDLQQALDEMETIVNCNGVQKMLDEAVLMSVQVLESVSARTKSFDITGTSAALRANPEFYRLCKLIWIKYRVFSQVPPETQLMLLVASTALLCRSANVGKRDLSELLNKTSV